MGKSPLLVRLFELDFNLEVIETLCKGLAKLPTHDRSMGFRGIRNLLFQIIGWGRDKEPFFENTSTDPILYSSEAWCEVKTYFYDMVFGEEG